MLPQAGPKIDLIRAGTASVLAHLILWTLFLPPANEAGAIRSGMLLATLQMNSPPQEVGPRAEEDAELTPRNRRALSDRARGGRSVGALQRPRMGQAPVGEVSSLPALATTDKTVTTDRDLERRIRLELAHEIARNASLRPVGDAGSDAARVARATIDFRAGHLAELRLQASSGSESVDQLALAMLAGAAAKIATSGDAAVNVTIELDGR